jgi:hypothetical protein
MKKEEFKLVFGIDRRAQGPMELKRVYDECDGSVEYFWRYNGSEWSSDIIPGEIADLFYERIDN